VSPERRGLIAYLSSDQVKPAARVDADSKPAAGSGAVTVAFEQGAVLLEPKEGAPLRLVWKKGDASKSRPVPAGSYVLKHYSIEAEHKGETWVLSAAAAQHGHGLAIVIEEGKETKLPIEPKLQLKCGAKPKRGAVMVNSSLQGDHKMPATVARAGKLIEIKGKLKAGDREAGEASMRYG